MITDFLTYLNMILGACRVSGSHTMITPAFYKQTNLGSKAQSVSHTCFSFLELESRGFLGTWKSVSRRSSTKDYQYPLLFILSEQTVHLSYEKCILYFYLFFFVLNNLCKYCYIYATIVWFIRRKITDISNSISCLTLRNIIS